MEVFIREKKKEERIKKTMMALLMQCHSDLVEGTSDSGLTKQSVKKTLNKKYATYNIQPKT